MIQQYAVIRDVGCGQKTFHKWHDTLYDAKKEAERLARKEQARFMVIKLVGRCWLEERPVKWENEGDD